MSEIEKQLLPNLAEIWQKTLGWEPDELQQQQFQQLYEGILLGNRQLNLTRITAPKDFWEKHLWDSLVGIKYLDFLDCREKKKSLKAIDIGTGAGFPGIPVAIAFPAWTVTLLDATRKKINFLQELVAAVGIENVKTISRRAEAIGREKLHRETYDLALLRAVGAVSVCAEYALPLIKIDGLAILYRGRWSEEDNLALESAASKLGGKIEFIEELKTPLTESIRHCVYLRKLSRTPAQFPRAVGLPTRQPL